MFFNNAPFGGSVYLSKATWETLEQWDMYDTSTPKLLWSGHLSSWIVSEDVRCVDDGRELCSPKPLWKESRYLVRWPNRCLRTTQLRGVLPRLSHTWDHLFIFQVCTGFNHPLSKSDHKATSLSRRWNYWEMNGELWVFKSWPVEFSLILFIYVLNVERTKGYREQKLIKRVWELELLHVKHGIQSMGYRGTQEATAVSHSVMSDCGPHGL